MAKKKAPAPASTAGIKQVHTAPQSKNDFPDRHIAGGKWLEFWFTQTETDFTRALTFAAAEKMIEKHNSSRFVIKLCYEKRGFLSNKVVEKEYVGRCKSVAAIQKAMATVIAEGELFFSNR